MALTKKKKIWITVGTVITVIVLALAITIGVLFWPKVMPETDYTEVLNYSGYNKAADTKLVNEWKKLEGWKNIDFENDSALDIVNSALHNTSITPRHISFIITESDLFGDPGTRLENLVFRNKSSYLSGTADGMSYTQTISQPQDLRLGSLNGTTLASNFGYVTRSFNNHTQSGSNGHFRRGAKDAKPDPVQEPAGALASWGKLAAKSDYTSDDVMTVADGDWTRYRGGLKDGNKVKDPVTKDTVGTIRLSNGERIPIWGPYTYQIDEEVIDAEASKATIEKKGDYYSVTLVYKQGESKYKAQDGKPLYSSIIDQACRYAGSSLASDLFSVPTLKIDTIVYTELTMTYEIWNNGLLKAMNRKETMTANVSALGNYEGHGGTRNKASEVYSYDNKDTVEYITEMYKQAGATK